MKSLSVKKPNPRPALRSLEELRKLGYQLKVFNKGAGKRWHLLLKGVEIYTWCKLPTSSEIDAAIFWHGFRSQYAEPDPDAPDTLGWRVWKTIILTLESKTVLVSPQRLAVWYTPELRVENWDDNRAVRGVEGIHALRMPKDWRRAKWSDSRHGRNYGWGEITGIVERFGRFVLGEDGWRAEWVIIRGLVAPTTELGLALEQTYPDVEIVYADQLKEE